MMVGWLVDERGIEPHVNLIDKSERTDGTFSREPTSHSIPNATSMSVPEVRSCENLAAPSTPREGVAQDGATAIAPLNATATPRAQTQVLSEYARTQDCASRS